MIELEPEKRLSFAAVQAHERLDNCYRILERKGSKLPEQLKARAKQVNPALHSITGEGRTYLLGVSDAEQSHTSSEAASTTGARPKLHLLGRRETRFSI